MNKMVDDTSLFSKIIDPRNSQNTLNSDLKYISWRAHQWKMQSNAHPKLEENDAAISRKSNTNTYPSVIFTINLITTCSDLKHLSLSLIPY